MSTTTEEPAVAYSDIVKTGAGYENHDKQPKELVPGLETHSTDDVSYAAVAREGPRARTASLTKRTNAPTKQTDDARTRRDSSSSNKPLPPAKSNPELSIDMAANSPITLKRRVGQDGVNEEFPHPSIARARFAPDPRDGTTADSNARAAWESALPAESSRHWERRSAIEKHCAFFDTDLDGIISPRDTFAGLRAIGFNLLMALVSTVIIHFGFAYVSQPGVLPDPFFRFHVGNAYHCKHGSDSDTYDTEGRYVPQKFDDIFSKYSSSPENDYLTVSDTIRMLRGNRVVVDPFGWFAAVFEWLAFWYLMWPRDGRLQRSDVRAIYTGELFYEIAARRKEDRKTGRKSSSRKRQEVQSD